MGVIDVEGEIVAVFDPRHRFGLPPRLIAASDYLVLARLARRRAALTITDRPRYAIHRRSQSCADSSRSIRQRLRRHQYAR